MTPGTFVPCFFDCIDGRDPGGLSVHRADSSRSSRRLLRRAGGTQVPRAVVEAMADYLYHHNANTHWSFPSSAETDSALLEARRALADFLNATPDGNRLRRQHDHV